MDNKTAYELEKMPTSLSEFMNENTEYEEKVLGRIQRAKVNTQDNQVTPMNNTITKEHPVSIAGYIVIFLGIIFIYFSYKLLKKAIKEKGSLAYKNIRSIKFITKIILIIAFAISLFDMESSYYELLRFFGTIGFIYLSLDARKKNSNWWYVWGISALLLNPFFRINLDHSVWSIINIIWSLLLIASFKYKKKNNREDKIKDGASIQPDNTKTIKETQNSYPWGKIFAATIILFSIFPMFVYGFPSDIFSVGLVIGFISVPLFISAIITAVRDFFGKKSINSFYKTSVIVILILLPFMIIGAISS